MDETRVNWWMDDTSRWHRGFPPTGWWQSEDGRWHPPGEDDEPTEEMWQVPQEGAAHRARGTGSTIIAGVRERAWARLAVLASMAILAVVVVVGAAAITGRGGGDQDAATGDVSTTVAPSTSVASAPTALPPGSASSGSGTPASGDSDPSAPPTTARATTTTTRPSTTAPPTTSPPPTTPSVRLSAACSPEGATAVSDDGIPVTCTTQKCHGAPFDSPRWRRTAC
jgi:hypothetical protein